MIAKTFIFTDIKLIFAFGVEAHLCRRLSSHNFNYRKTPCSVAVGSQRFSYDEDGAPRSKPPVPLSSWSLRQTVCSTFSKSGWSIVRSASLAKGGYSKKRPSPYLHKVPTRSNKASPRTFQTTLVFLRKYQSVQWSGNHDLPIWSNNTILISNFINHKHKSKHMI
jgi:hypothetical protein